MNMKAKDKDDKNAILGAYDKNGQWWNREDIHSFPNAAVLLCFGKEIPDIKIVKKETNNN